ncbi:hypothetical protein MB27_09650 [Actinoplanes utahensis]|uniref:Uncharacterized protein n=2 Tax=Actinoplanes utahensis TaxID=1869 RepID=A0A0A6URS9_ACTUT|nr:hypothetical protein MB27_09650 [Actinoplanes utahensis]
MSLWRNVRGEMAGAWRSICYDLGRRRAAPSSPRPDVTSTGMETFPGSLVGLPVPPVETDARPPRRFVAVAAFCALSLCGAAGSYLVATTAFADRMGDRVSPVAPPAAAPARPAFEATEDAMGGVPASTGRPRTAIAATAATGPGPARPPGTTAPAAPAAPAAARKPAPPAAARPAPGRTGIPEVTTSPDCGCEAPPVPTPTAPSPTPSVSDSGSPSPSASPDTSLSPTPDTSSPGQRSDRRHRRQRH